MSHYAVDMNTVRAATRRSKKTELAHARELGWFSYLVYEVVPLSAIKAESVWNPPRLDRGLEKMRAGVSLDPIRVDRKDGRFEIGDGIHRFNASIAMGYTHIPVLYSVVVEAPELLEPLEEAKPQLGRGAWVRLLPGRQWAVVDEYLGERSWRGVLHHAYALVGVEGGQAEFLGDHIDTKLEIAQRLPPAAVVAVLEADYPVDPKPRFHLNGAARVASRFLRARAG